MLSSDFNLTSTYFVILRIADVNPFEGTLGSVGLARYAVQVALAYKLDARQIPANWTTGYWLQGSDMPGETTTDIYGTEVFEVSFYVCVVILTVGFQVAGKHRLFGILPHFIPVLIAFLLFLIGVSSLTALTDKIDCGNPAETFSRCGIVKGLVVISWIDT